MAYIKFLKYKIIILLFLLVFFSFLLGVFVNFSLFENSKGFVRGIFLGNNISEIDAPSSYVNENQIEIYKDKVIIYIKDASLSRYSSTGSMKPSFDEQANGVRIKPLSVDEINLGDLVSYEKSGRIIVHRVVVRGTDENGDYFITKGDNNNYLDEKIRFEDVKYKTIALIF